MNHDGWLAALLDLVPSAAGDPLKIIVLGADDSGLTDALLTRFPSATVTLLEHTDAARVAAAQQLAAFGDRLRIVSFDLSSLEWWDRMFGADLVVSALHVGTLNDAKKQYLYRAAADRLSTRGALLLADALEPGQLLHHLVWLRHAGFALVDCFWRDGALAVFGGFKQASASAPPPRAGN